MILLLTRRYFKIKIFLVISFLLNRYIGQFQSKVTNGIKIRTISTRGRKLRYLPIYRYYRAIFKSLTDVYISMMQCTIPFAGK